MDRQGYEEYVAAFNARNYADVLDYYVEDLEILFAGHCFRGRAAFYRFYHAHASESIFIDAFAGGDELVAVEVRVHVEAKHDLTPEALKAEGMENMAPMRAGEVIEIPQFIHYPIRDGKFVKAVCVVVAPPNSLAAPVVGSPGASSRA